MRFGISLFKSFRDNFNAIKKNASIFRSFGLNSRFYPRELGIEASPPLFPEAVKQTNKLSFLAGSAALLFAGITGGYLLNKNVQQEVDEKIDDFMTKYANNIFLECMTNKIFRESVYSLREAEFLHYGISFEDNKDNAIFYRGMTLPSHIDETDQNKIKEWQMETINSMTGRGFSPLLWLTRPSATRAEGFNIHPHDGNPARANANDAPISWSADVIALTCEFNILKGYSGLDKPNETGCIILSAPKKILYLSSNDVKTRHEKYKAHEFEVITPYIDSQDTIAVLFITNGKISHVEINKDVIDKINNGYEYSVDVHLIDNLKKALATAVPEVKQILSDLIKNLESQKNRVDLINEFNSRFHSNVDELIDNTKNCIAECDEKISKMPGIIGAGLRTIKQENTVLSREELAKKMELPLPETPENKTDINKSI